MLVYECIVYEEGNRMEGLRDGGGVVCVEGGFFEEEDLSGVLVGPVGVFGEALDDAVT